ncbi:phytanoyl-CoA dioxygenase family protein [Fuerstiella marisgermanici]|uniref:Chlorinating enzyme n=1 Tax=Fuerstiella marisgermanici TaxID=1891926 RepID=A0A1P8WID4_9PLAN|nr:phytanoyl-CoA dioxygenase family protein [Fuerstiella marisgermanici]APZ93825.1 chlorinating enzyme [Fuerstiella marisgermanici]
MSASPDFKITPDDNELADIPRDLKFHPAATSSPAVLNEEQIRSYNDDGYIKPIDIYSTAEIAEIRDYFDGLLEKTLAAGGNSYSISTAHMKYGRVYDMLTNKVIVDCVADLLGDDVIAWGSHFFCKMPGDGKDVAWHQDASYWPLSPSKAVTVWLAIDDADVENGCMKFIAGSQHSGHLTYHKSDPGDHSVLDQVVENPEQYGPVVIDDLKAGQASIHNDLLLHGSDANHSNRRRCGLTLRYAAAEVRAAMGWNAKGLVVRGTDAAGHWGNPPRPTAE